MAQSPSGPLASQEERSWSGPLRAQARAPQSSGHIPVGVTIVRGQILQGSPSSWPAPAHTGIAQAKARGELVEQALGQLQPQRLSDELHGPSLGHQLTRSCARGLGPEGPELALPGCLLAAHTAQGPHGERDWLGEALTPAWAPRSVTTMILSVPPWLPSLKAGP